MLHNLVSITGARTTVQINIVYLGTIDPIRINQVTSSQEKSPRSAVISTQPS